MTKSHYSIVLILFILISCSGEKSSNTYLYEKGVWVDLTYDFSHDTIYWPTGKHFKLHEDFHGRTDKGYFYSSYSYSAAEHGGTHIDAPVHFSEGKHTVDQIPLERLIGKAVVVDISEKCLSDPDYQVTATDLMKWEKNHGKIPEGSMLLIRTGFGRYWPDKTKYMGTNQTGPAAVKKLHFPGLHPDAAKWLLDNRSVKAVGIDTPSIDYGQSELFRSHQILFAQNVPVFENVANMHRLPDSGFSIIALPMKIRGGSGAPTRIIAFIPE